MSLLYSQLLPPTRGPSLSNQIWQFGGTLASTCFRMSWNPSRNSAGIFTQLSWIYRLIWENMPFLQFEGFSSVQSLSRVRLFATPWTAACQASLSITNSQSLLKLMSVELVMPSNHLILCHHLLFPPSIFPSIWVFSNELVLHIRYPKYWSFSFSISSSNEYSGMISFRMD